MDNWERLKCFLWGMKKGYGDIGEDKVVRALEQVEEMMERWEREVTEGSDGQ